MSTLGDIAQAIKDRKLYPWKIFDLDPTMKPKRQLLAMEEIADQCGMEGFSGKNNFPRKILPNCRTRLDDFVAGAVMDPKYDLKHLELPVWEFKIPFSGKGTKATRILGWFCGFNTFIATHSEYREDLHGFDSPEWKDTMLKMHRKHDQICPNIPMLNYGSDLRKYIN